MDLEDLKKKIVVPKEYFEPWLKKHHWTFHQLARGEYPEPWKDLDEFQLGCLCADPVLWAETFLKDPDDPERRWQFWGFQKKSVRCDGNVLHQDAAEVGKTREIIAYILHKIFTTPNGSGLVTAPASTHYEEIVDELDSQLANSPIFKGEPLKHRKFPHHKYFFANGFVLYFRPMGYDGDALRGVHVSTFAMVDEAAKAKSKKIWKEFWRAPKPGCAHRIYSTPDGDRSTVYYRLCQGTDEDAAKEERDTLDTKTPTDFTKFHWGKPLMPHPFWSQERKRFYVKMYGSENTSEYQQNVLGNHGDPENSVFPWFQFEKTLKEIPAYRVLKIQVDDSQGLVKIFGAEYRSQIGDDQHKTQPKEVILQEKEITKYDFKISDEIKTFFEHIPGLKYGGADLGFTNDPTEILIKLVYGKQHRLIARLNLQGVTYNQQADSLDALDDIYDAGKDKMGWGVDFGCAGPAVVHDLQGLDKFSHKDYEARLTGYSFESTYEAVDESGEVIIDKKTKKPLKLTAKELATDLLTKKMQMVQLEYPHDPDIVLFYPNHTYRMGQRHRIFKKTDDHIIDADRVLMLRIVLEQESLDMFASGN